MKTIFADAIHLIDNATNFFKFSMRENFEIYLNLQQIYVESISFTDDSASYCVINISETSRDVFRCESITSKHLQNKMTYVCNNQNDVDLVMTRVSQMLAEECNSEMLFSV